MTPCRMESRPSDRTDGPLFEGRQRRRQRAAAQDERKIGCLLLREVAFDHALIFDLRLDVRGRHDLVVEHDRQAAADVRPGERAELPRAVGRERHADVSAGRAAPSARGRSSDRCR